MKTFYVSVLALLCLSFSASAKTAPTFSFPSDVNLKSAANAEQKVETAREQEISDLIETQTEASSSNEP